MRLVRSHAHEWQFDKVGIMGFSAGAVTTTYIMLNHDDSSRPDFAGVIYGGWDVPQVPADACPLYMCSPVNDAFQPVETQNLFNAWREAKKPVEPPLLSESRPRIWRKNHYTLLTSGSTP